PRRVSPARGSGPHRGWRDGGPGRLDGSIPWLCVPRFDAAPLFCALLDREKGGQFTVAPEGVVAARQYYERDTGVLITEHQTPTGLVRITDALALRSRADLTDDAPAHRGALIRSVAVVEGSARIDVGIQPRGGARAEAVFSGFEIQAFAR